MSHNGCGRPITNKNKKINLKLAANNTFLFLEKIRMSLNKSNPIDITFKNLHYSVLTPKGPRIILNDIEGICKSGEITAILGMNLN